MIRKICKYLSIFSLTSVILFVGCTKQNQSLNVTDGIGRSVSIEKTPSKIISLGAASTEILYEVGAANQIAAVSSFSDYPEEAKSLPQIGGFDANSISLETIISFEPDFVILYKGMHDVFIPTFEELNIPYYVSDVKTIEGVIEEIKNIAILTGHSDVVNALETKYRGQLALSATKTINPVTVYYEIWNSPYMSCGNESFINEIISCAGGKNIFGEVEGGYPVVSEEEIIAANPDFIILPASSYIPVKSVKERKEWSNIEAVKNNNIIFVDDNIYNRAGPRVFDAISDLHNILYTK